MILEKQTAWGSKFLTQVSNELKSEFPDIQGFSETNLKYCKLFYSYFSNKIDKMTYNIDEAGVAIVQNFISQHS